MKNSLPDLFCIRTKKNRLDQFDMDPILDIH